MFLRTSEEKKRSEMALNNHFAVVLNDIIQAVNLGLILAVRMINDD
jgi:hypothetical protein